MPRLLTLVFPLCLSLGLLLLFSITPASAQSLVSLPPCALPCANTAATAAGCTLSDSDTSCLCKGAFISATLQCSKSVCRIEDQSSAGGLLEEICASVITTSSKPPSSSGSSSSTRPSTTKPSPTQSPTQSPSSSTSQTSKSPSPISTGTRTTSTANTTSQPGVTTTVRNAISITTTVTPIITPTPIRGTLSVPPSSTTVVRQTITADPTGNAARGLGLGKAEGVLGALLLGVAALF